MKLNNKHYRKAYMNGIAEDSTALFNDRESFKMHLNDFIMDLVADCTTLDEALDVVTCVAEHDISTQYEEDENVLKLNYTEQDIIDIYCNLAETEFNNLNK